MKYEYTVIKDFLLLDIIINTVFKNHTDIVINFNYHYFANTQFTNTLIQLTKYTKCSSVFNFVTAHIEFTTHTDTQTARY